MKLGTFIKKLTSAIGIKPCSRCEKRATDLDKRGFLRGTLALLALALAWPFRALGLTCSAPMPDGCCDATVDCTQAQCGGGIAGGSFTVGCCNQCASGCYDVCISNCTIVWEPYGGCCAYISWYDRCARTRNKACTCCPGISC